MRERRNYVQENFVGLIGDRASWESSVHFAQSGSSPSRDLTSCLASFARNLCFALFGLNLWRELALVNGISIDTGN